MKRTTEAPQTQPPQPPPQPRPPIPARLSRRAGDPVSTAESPDLSSSGGGGNGGGSVSAAGGAGGATSSVTAALLGRHVVEVPDPAEGGVYRGEVSHDGKRSGTGTYTYKSGDVFSGRWENGAQNGKGKFVWKVAGCAFKGVFYNGQAVTRGTIRFAQEVQSTQWFREGIAVQLIDAPEEDISAITAAAAPTLSLSSSSSLSLSASSSVSSSSLSSQPAPPASPQKPVKSSSSSSVASSSASQQQQQQPVVDENVTNFRNHLASWKQLHATIGSQIPPLWTVQQMVPLVNALAESESLPLLVLATAAAMPQRRGLVLTFPDLEVGTFVPLSDVINKTTVLEKVVECFCKNVSGITRDNLRSIVASSLCCKSLEVDTIIVAIADLHDALQRSEVSSSLRTSLSAAAGKAVGLFRRPPGSAFPAIAAAIGNIETSALQQGKGAAAVVDTEGLARLMEVLGPLLALHRERRALEKSILNISMTFDATRKVLDASKVNEATAWCVQSILDIYIMSTADTITQRISRVSLWRDIIRNVVMPKIAGTGASPARSTAVLWCNGMVGIALGELEETSHTAKILPRLRNQREPWDFWEIDQLLGELGKIRMSLASLVPGMPPPMPPRPVERKPIARPDARPPTTPVPQKPYSVLKNGLIPLNKELVGLVNRGRLSLLSDLFNSCDNIIQTFAAKLLATIVLPWERQSEAVTSDRRAELVCSEQHCAELLGLIVWHTVNGTMNTNLRRDALHLLSRIVTENPKMKELLMMERPSGKTWLSSMVSLLQASTPLRVLALQVICNIATIERYRKAVHSQIGVWALHKVMAESAPEGDEAETLAGQILGYLLSEHAVLKEAQELGSLARVVDLARAGRIILHYQILEEDIELGKEIGRGAYATVFQAKWNGKTVAAKVFSETSFQFRLEDFLLEVAILSIVRHPNLMHMYGAVVHQSKEAHSTFMLVTELLDSSVQRLLIQRKGGLPVQSIHKYASDVASALQYLHSLNMIHRDVKTANLLVDSDGNVKVCDLGLSRLASNLSMTACAGTPKWEAPECLEGGNYSTMADVYSFGIVLWEMVTGQEPFPDIRSIFELKKAVMDKKRRPDIPASCPAWLKELMRACWHATPKKRPNFDQIVERLATVKAFI